MKLLVILLCLLSERYLVHAVSYLRFDWFRSYCNKITQYLGQIKLGLNPALVLIAFVLPLVFSAALILYLTSHLLFGLFSFLLQVVIFYYCLGPTNPFYPVREENTEETNELDRGTYFAKVNGQLFSVIFWYVVAGPLAVLSYRLISLCREQELTASLATKLTNLLEWVPARITVLLFLLVGNFQKAIQFYGQQFISGPENNERLLSEGGLLALCSADNEPLQEPYTEKLVEHALIAYLVLLALFTLVALV